jgi:hypothetical protein
VCAGALHETPATCLPLLLQPWREGNTAMPSEEQLFAHRVPRHEEGLFVRFTRFLCLSLELAMLLVQEAACLEIVLMIVPLHLHTRQQLGIKLMLSSRRLANAPVVKAACSLTTSSNIGCTPFGEWWPRWPLLPAEQAQPSQTSRTVHKQPDPGVYKAIRDGRHRVEARHRGRTRCLFSCSQPLQAASTWCY